MRCIIASRSVTALHNEKQSDDRDERWRRFYSADFHSWVSSWLEVLWCTTESKSCFKTFMNCGTFERRIYLYVATLEVVCVEQFKNGVTSNSFQVWMWGRTLLKKKAKAFPTEYGTREQEHEESTFRHLQVINLQESVTTGVQREILSNNRVFHKSKLCFFRIIKNKPLWMRQHLIRLSRPHGLPVKVIPKRVTCSQTGLNKGFVWYHQRPNDQWLMAYFS